MVNIPSYQVERLVWNWANGGQRDHDGRNMHSRVSHRHGDVQKVHLG
jgi:hypothetical protein